MEKPLVIIQVTGGVAYITHCSPDVQVIIWDYDNEEAETADGCKYEPANVTKGIAFQPTNDTLTAYIQEHGLPEQIDAPDDKFEYLVDCANDVVNEWDGGDLAGAVNAMRIELEGLELREVVDADDEDEIQHDEAANTFRG